MKKHIIIFSISVFAIGNISEANPTNHHLMEENFLRPRPRKRDRAEDIRDRREDIRDRKEDIRDKREDIRDAQFQGGPRDRREDIRDQREDVRDRKEDIRDRRENRRDRRRRL